MIKKKLNELPNLVCRVDVGIMLKKNFYYIRASCGGKVQCSKSE